MRVLLIASEAPPVTSGVARCVDRLVEGLRAAGHQVDIVSNLPRLTVGEFRISSFAAKWPGIASGLPHYDLVNLHGPVPTMSDVFFVLSRLLRDARRPPIVYTHHCQIDLDGLRAACDAYNAMHRRLAHRADRIITTSHSYREMIESPGGPPVDVVPWGVDAHAPERSRPLEPGPFRVLFVGQMRPYKGVDNLLAAVAGLPDIELTLAGDGPLKEAYIRRARELGALNATFLGRIEDDELAKLYRESDAIVLPSTTTAEAFGLVLLEGMAAGCVPVASNLPGVRDVAAPTGVIVEPGDVRGLRDALAMLAADRERSYQMGLASQRAAAAFGWDSVVARYESVFRRTLLRWRTTHGTRLLPPTWSPPERMLEQLGGRFNATRASLLVFERSMEAPVRAAWGSVPVDRLREHPPRIARYVARTRRPLLLDQDTAPVPVREWLVRDDIASALSVPIPSTRGTLGVLNLSISPEEGHRYSTRDLDALVSTVAV